MQFQSDILGIPVDVPEQIESTSLGSAFIAGLATGIWTDRADIARIRKTARRYEPHMDQDQREAGFQRWHMAVERSRSWSEERS